MSILGYAIDMHGSPKHIESAIKNLPKDCSGDKNGMFGKKHSEATREKIRQRRLGTKHSVETRLKMSVLKRGDKCHAWRGGVTKLNKIIRVSLEYRLWREAVFKRDNYQCIWGGKEHGSKLHADHIKPFALFPELRFAIDNGRTLCVPCHKTTDTFAGKSNRTNK